MRRIVGTTFNLIGKRFGVFGTSERVEGLDSGYEETKVGSSSSA